MMHGYYNINNLRISKKIKKVYFLYNNKILTFTI